MSFYVQPPSHYLEFLPGIYQEDEFLGQLLCIFESLLLPVEAIIDEINCYFDPDLVPLETLPWLASWIGMVLDLNWPEDKQRELIKRSGWLYRWRGTRKGMNEFLRIYTGSGAEIVIDEEQGRDEHHVFHFQVTVKATEPEKLDLEIIKAIVESEKPAHTFCEACVIKSKN